MYTTTPNGWSPTNTCTNCPGFDSSDCCGGTATWQNNWNNGFTGFNGWNGFNGFGGFNGFNGFNGFGGFGGFNGPFGWNTPRSGTNFPWVTNGFGRSTPWNSTPWNSTPWNFGGWNNTPNATWSNGWNNTQGTLEAIARDAFRAGFESGFCAACTSNGTTQAPFTANTATCGGNGAYQASGTCFTNPATTFTPQGTRGNAPVNSTTNAPSNSTPNYTPNYTSNSTPNYTPNSSNPALHGPFQGNGFWNAACGNAPQGTNFSNASPNLSGDEFAHGVKCCDERGECGTPAYAGMKVRSVA